MDGPKGYGARTASQPIPIKSMSGGLGAIDRGALVSQSLPPPAPVIGSLPPPTDPKLAAMPMLSLPPPSPEASSVMTPIRPRMVGVSSAPATSFMQQAGRRRMGASSGSPSVLSFIKERSETGEKMGDDGRPGRTGLERHMGSMRISDKRGGGGGGGIAMRGVVGSIPRVGGALPGSELDMKPMDDTPSTAPGSRPRTDFDSDTDDSVDVPFPDPETEPFVPFEADY